MILSIPPNYYFRKPRSAAAQAFTLVEVMWATVILILFLAATFYGNARALSVLRASKETVFASNVLQQRNEQLRMANWSQLNDSSYLVGIYGTAANSASQLSSVTETLTISKWPVASPSPTPIKITRTGPSAAIVTNNLDLIDEPTLRANLQITWRGTPGGKTRVREVSGIFANGGLGL